MKTCFRYLVPAAILLWMACRPAAAQPVQNGFAAGTCFSDNIATNPVAVLMDVRLAHLQTPFLHWAAPKTYGPASSPWTRANLGEVFGVAFDPSGNIYVAATTVYGNATPGGPAGSGAIYRLDAVTGMISTFATLPNAGCGLGNIAWDATHNQMFATNFEDGKIYRISSAGAVLSTFDPFNPDPIPTVNGPAAIGELIWGIAYNPIENSVYFGRWVENTSSPSTVMNNQVWSIALDGTGNFTGTEQLKITMPSLPSRNYSNPVSDIAFSAAGNMLLAERSMWSNTSPLSPTAHESRVLEYSLVGGVWTPTPAIFSIGMLGNGGPGRMASASGGVDYAYASYNTTTKQLENCDGAVWATGDALRFDNSPVNYIYGFQRLPAAGGTAPASVMIDADGVTTSQDKTQIGDVEVYKRCTPVNACDDLTLTVDTTDDCCYELSVSGYNAGDLTSIIANLLTSGVVFTGAIGPTGWNVTNSGTQATWDSAGIITGTSATGLRFCLQSTVSPPQQIEIVYRRKDGTECKDTITVYCDSVEYTPCVVFNNEQIRCKEKGPKGWSYGVSFTVTNYSPFSQAPWFLPAENVVVYSATGGVTVAPGAVALSPTLGYGATSGTLNFTLAGSGLQPGQQVCLIVQLHGRKFLNDYQWCCPPGTICFTVPHCAECCDSVDITINNNTGRQIGNTAAGLSSANVTVTPGPITKFQASVMSVSRSRVWCPNPNTGVYAPVSNPTTIGAVITGGSVSPSMPLSSGFSPATSEVIWGTVYSGVNFNPGSVNLNLSFPGTNLGWRCRDTLRVCIRYTFTDTACRTCDTVVYYTVPRCGRADIVDYDHDTPIDLNPVSFAEAVLGEGITVGEPLYSEVVPGPGLELSLTSQTAGTLAVSHWWNDAVVGIDKLRVVRMKVVPEPGIEITGLTPQGGGAAATLADRTATIEMDLRENEIDNFGVTFSNPTNADFFALRVRFDVVDTDDPQTEMPSHEYVVYGDLTGGGGPQGRISVDESDRSTPTLYKLLIGSNGQNSADWISPACFRFTPPQGVRILASGPMPDSTFAEFHVLKSMSKESSMLLQLPSPGDFRKEYIANDQSVALWLVLEGGGDLFDLEWEALNMDGEIIGAGDVQLSPTSTVYDGEDYVPGASIHLLETYPNPARDRVMTRFTLGRSEEVTVSLYDMSGREVSRLVDKVRLGAGSHEYELNLKSLSSGAYYIRMTTSAGTQTKSVVKR